MFTAIGRVTSSLVRYEEVETRFGIFSAGSKSTSETWLNACLGIAISTILDIHGE
jgi:hypothetical protein